MDASCAAQMHFSPTTVLYLVLGLTDPLTH